MIESINTKVVQHYCQTMPNKLDLISSLPDCQLNSVHHLSKYDGHQSRADKSSAGSNHSFQHYLTFTCQRYQSHWSA